MDDKSFGLGRDAYTMGTNARFGMSVDEEKQPPMTASGPGAVCTWSDEDNATPMSQGFDANMSRDCTYVFDEKANTIRVSAKPGVCTTKVKGIEQFTLAEENQTPADQEKPYGLALQSSAGLGGISEDTSQTVISGDNPGWQTGVADKPNNEPHYIVRRLTPTECARLQGFPDAWCSDLGTKRPKEEDIDWWQKVWDEWQDINGLPRKSRRNVIRWLKDPYSDAAEYKMWGNGVALPCVQFILAGIEWATRTDPKVEPPQYEKQISIFDF